MIPQLQRAQRRPERHGAPQPHHNGRLKEQRAEDYAPTPSVDQMAGQEARRIIRESSMDDKTSNWRALKRAYLCGYEDAQRP